MTLTRVRPACADGSGHGEKEIEKRHGFSTLGMPAGLDGFLGAVRIRCSIYLKVNLTSALIAF